MAIRDAALLLTYCYKGFDSIIEMEEDLDVIFKEIISKILILVSGNLDRMVDI